MLKIIFSSGFKKIAKKFFKKNPYVFHVYEKILFLLKDNPRHPSLRLHKLSGDLSGLYSVSINMQYRITIELEIRENEIILVNIGSHDDVY